MKRWLGMVGTVMVDTMAPLVMGSEVLVGSMDELWQRVMEEYGVLLEGNNGLADDPQLLRKSALPRLMLEVVNQLAKEQKRIRNEGSPRANQASTGGSLIYFLEHDLADQLGALGMPDRPPGIRLLVTNVFDSLLNLKECSIMAYSKVCVAVANYVETILNRGDLHNPLTKSGTASLLKSVALWIAKESSVLEYFLRTAPDKTCSLEVLVGLQSLIREEEPICSYAFEGILCCLKCRDERVDDFVLNRSSLLQQLASSLCEDYANLVDEASDERDLAVINGLPATKIFVDWLQKLDSCVQTASPRVASALVEVIRTGWAEKMIPDNLLSSNEQVAICATMQFRKLILPNVWSSMLLGSLLDFVIGRPGDQRPVRRTLIQRIHHLSEELSLETLLLFDYILKLRLPITYHRIVLDDLVTRFPELQDRDLTLEGSTFDLPQELKEMLTYLPEPSDSSMENYMVDHVTNAELWYPTFMRWMKELRVQTSDVASNASLSNDFGLMALSPSPKSSISPPFVKTSPDLDTDAKSVNSEIILSPANSSQDSLFLDAIFNKMSTVLENSFPVNLALTGIISSLASCPHPALHVFFLDPNLSLSDPNQRTLFGVLQSVWKSSYQRLSNMPKFEERLADVREGLATGQVGQSNVESMDSSQFLQGLIVLREFVQELAAISPAQTALVSLIREQELIRTPQSSADKKLSSEAVPYLLE